MKNFKSHRISKLCTVAVAGLIASNLLTSLSYPVFATDERNTATYSSGADGYTITYDGKSYTLASNDLSGSYYWGFNQNTSNSYFNDLDVPGPGTFISEEDGSMYGGTWGVNNAWGGGGDTADNGYDSGNPRSERQGPCLTGWHVPSRGERNAIAIAWCHLSSNNCTESDLIHDYEWTASNNLVNIHKSGLGTQFMSDFGIDIIAWSSSPDGDYDAWQIYAVDDDIVPGYGDIRSNFAVVRCLKNSTSEGEGSGSSAFTRDEVESRSASGTLTAQSFSFIMPNHNVYLYAITAPNEYYVHYDGNESTAGTMSDSDYTYDTTGYLAPNAFEKLGYTWTEWNTQANGGGTSYASGAKVWNWRTDTGTTTIYAQWSAAGYQITYLLNSGTVSSANPDTYTIETETFTLHNPTRTNSTFLGWSGTAISGISGIVTIAQGSMGNRTYEANFTCNTGYHLNGANNCVNNAYRVVVYNVDGTHGTPMMIENMYDVTGNIFPMPSQSGYDFVGWEVSGMSGGVAHYIGTITTTGDTYTYSGSTNQFKNLTVEQGGIVTFTALWEARNDTAYTVYHYIKNVGTNTYTLSGTDYLSGTTDTEVIFNTKLKTFTGFIYSGGYLSGSSTRPAGVGVTTGNINKDGSLEIYLYYDRINYHVYLSGDVHVDTLSGAGVYEYGANVTVTATPKPGYHFVRWEKRDSF